MLRSPVMFTYPPNQDISETAVNQRLLPSINDRDVTLDRIPMGATMVGDWGRNLTIFLSIKQGIYVQHISP